jgi:hypothetical protein
MARATIGASVRKSVFILFVMAVFIPACSGEARWCDITGHDESNKLTYPPIAKAARISGTVLARITYTPQGDVKDVTSVSGPPMLATPVATQLRTWHLKTDASGADLCQSLAIIDFRIASPDSSPVPPPQSMPRSMFRVSVVGEQLVLYSTSDVVPKDNGAQALFLF